MLNFAQAKFVKRPRKGRKRNDNKDNLNNNYINDNINNDTCFTEKQLHQLHSLIKSFLNITKLTKDISCIKANQQLEPQKLYPIFSTITNIVLNDHDKRPRHRAKKIALLSTIDY